jgi:uncharacterized membrane protein YeiH
MSPIGSLIAAPLPRHLPVRVAAALAVRGGWQVEDNSVESLLRRIDRFGTVVFAFSGTLTAVGNDMGVLGAMILATVTAVGGGTIRDLLLGAGRKAFWIDNVSVLNVCVITCLLTLTVWPVLARRLDIKDNSAWPFCLSDALGMSAFAVLGADRGLDANCSPQGGVVCGLLSATGGGVVRDVLCLKPPRILQANRSMYGTPALVGSMLYVTMRTVLSAREDLALAVGFLGCLSLRVCAFTFGIAPPSAKTPLTLNKVGGLVD